MDSELKKRIAEGIAFKRHRKQRKLNQQPAAALVGEDSKAGQKRVSRFEQGENIDDREKFVGLLRRWEAETGVIEVNEAGEDYEATKRNPWARQVKELHELIECLEDPTISAKRKKTRFINTISFYADFVSAVGAVQEAGE